MKTPREWADEFDRRWTANVRNFARDVGVLDLLAEVIGEALAERDAEVARLQKLTEGLAVRVAAQSELLSRRAERDDQ